MFTIAMDRRHNVTLLRFTGEFGPEVIGHLDHAGELLVRAEGPTHFLFDFTGIERINMPDAAIARRGGWPQLCAGHRRVIVAPQPELFGLYRVFAAKQLNVGSGAPIVVKSMREAFVHLGLRLPVFEPVDMQALRDQARRSTP